MAYRFIQIHHELFGVRWLLRRMGILPNAYYNFLKNRKSAYHAQKQKILAQIQKLYHDHKGVDGYRQMKGYLNRKGISLSTGSVHKYMNKELGLHSIVRRKKPYYRKGNAHKVFADLLEQQFYADRRNQKWCTDFTYLFLTDGSKSYNCTILDLYDRSIVASITGQNITAGLAVRMLKKALNAHAVSQKGLMLHRDQGSQYTSRDFVEFCESAHITQSMSRAGCPYDNAPMERYYNTLKNELVNLHHYHTAEELYQSIEEFAYVTDNHVRPHSYNDYKTPFEARYQKST